MTNKQDRKERKIYNVEGVVKKKEESKKGSKPKGNTNKGEEFGSGRIEGKNGGNMPKKNRKLPDIKSLEKEVLQYIVGQDKQVRQIITAIYRAINFKSIKSNILIIGDSGTGKTATIEQIAKRLHIPYTIEDDTKYQLS